MIPVELEVKRFNWTLTLVLVGTLLFDLGLIFAVARGLTYLKGIL
jgi:hypothetical protein